MSDMWLPRDYTSDSDSECGCTDIECSNHSYEYYIPKATDRLEGARYDPLNPMRNLIKCWNSPTVDGVAAEPIYTIMEFDYWISRRLIWEISPLSDIEIIVKLIEKNPGIAKYITYLPSVFFIYETPKVEKINIYEDYDIGIAYN